MATASATPIQLSETLRATSSGKARGPEILAHDCPHDADGPWKTHLRAAPADCQSPGGAGGGGSAGGADRLPRPGGPLPGGREAMANKGPWCWRFAADPSGEGSSCGFHGWGSAALVQIAAERGSTPRTAARGQNKTRDGAPNFRQETL